MKKQIRLLSLLFLVMSLSGCDRTFEPASHESFVVTDSITDSNSLDSGGNMEQEEKQRENRNLSTESNKPENKITESSFRKISDTEVLQVNSNVYMVSAEYRLEFSASQDGYSIQLVHQSVMNPTDSANVMFTITNPAKLYFRGQAQRESKYQEVSLQSYGVLAIATITSKNGSIFRLEDRYYFPSDTMSGVFNVQRAVKVIKANTSDKGYQSIFSIETLTNTTDNLEWFVPNSVFKDFPETSSTQPYKLYRETLIGLPLAMVRDADSGYSVALARYQPVIDYESNSFACLSIHNGKTSSDLDASSVEITYPTRDTARRYFDVVENSQVVYDMDIILDQTETFDEAMVNTYTKQFELQDQRIVNTDIDEVYQVINEDFKTFMLSNKKNGITSYGLPWRVTIENGKIGPMSYQAGFVGQQIPCAYNMMLYGIKNQDSESLQNGMNIINFWIHDAKMMTSAGVPMIWYDGSNNRWAGYPTFTRMAVDAMEGLLDAYRLAKAYQLETTGWYEAIAACADWFVKAQNNDGSWYRCYNYQGTYYQGNESDITWNPGDIARSTSKNNSTMPIRFLGKMYEMTHDLKYLTAIKKGGDFIYQNLYPQHAYFGGTCDNPDCMDKEAGVYAMYAYDTLYTLTNDEKWLTCLKQAAVFTMSSVLTVSFKIPANASKLKAAYSLQCGYTDGLSYICAGGTSLDNYAAYMYYELFRLYIYSEEKIYYDMAEFIQQNTKSTMDWDGTLNYAYKSLTPEATTIYSFGFSSAEDDDGVAGVWLPWQSAANAEPIAKMYETFADADVKTFEKTNVSELQTILHEYGVGGNAHKKIN